MYCSVLFSLHQPFCVPDLETVPPGFQCGIEFDQQKSATVSENSAAFKGNGCLC